MLELSATFYVSSTTDVAALAKVLQSLAQLGGPPVVIHGGGGQLSAVPLPSEFVAPSDVVPADAPPDESPGAPVLPGPGVATRKRGRPKKPVESTVQGVPAEPALAATPPPPLPPSQVKVVQAAVAPPSPSKSDAEIQRELFGGDDENADENQQPATLADLQAAMQNFIKKRSAKAAKDVFDAHGFVRLSDVPPEKFRMMVDALRA